jgi:hypothetical protein
MLAAEKHKATFLAPIGIGLALFIAELAGSSSILLLVSSLMSDQASTGPVAPSTRLVLLALTSSWASSTAPIGFIGLVPRLELSSLLSFTDWSRFLNTRRAIQAKTTPAIHQSLQSLNRPYPVSFFVNGTDCCTPVFTMKSCVELDLPFAYRCRKGHDGVAENGDDYEEHRTSHLNLQHGGAEPMHHSNSQGGQQNEHPDDIARAGQAVGHSQVDGAFSRSSDAEKGHMPSARY